MLRTAWNALRIGDLVVVHDTRDAQMNLLAGVVEEIQTMRGTNDIGIRVEPEGHPSRILRPARQIVHLVPATADEECWRCEAIEARLDTVGALPTDSA